MISSQSHESLMVSYDGQTLHALTIVTVSLLDVESDVMSNSFSSAHEEASPRQRNGKKTVRLLLYRVRADWMLDQTESDDASLAAAAKEITAPQNQNEPAKTLGRRVSATFSTLSRVCHIINILWLPIWICVLCRVHCSWFHLNLLGLLWWLLLHVYYIRWRRMSLFTVILIVLNVLHIQVYDVIHVQQLLSVKMVMSVAILEILSPRKYAVLVGLASVLIASSYSARIFKVRFVGEAVCQPEGINELRNGECIPSKASRELGLQIKREVSAISRFPLDGNCVQKHSDRWVTVLYRYCAWFEMLWYWMWSMQIWLGCIQAIDILGTRLGKYKCGDISIKKAEMSKQELRKAVHALHPAYVRMSVRRGRCSRDSMLDRETHTSEQVLIYRISTWFSTCHAWRIEVLVCALWL